MYAVLFVSDCEIRANILEISQNCIKSSPQEENLLMWNIGNPETTFEYELPLFTYALSGPSRHL